MNLNLGPLIGNLHRYPVPIGQTSPETLSFLRPQRSCLPSCRTDKHLELHDYGWVTSQRTTSQLLSVSEDHQVHSEACLRQLPISTPHQRRYHVHIGSSSRSCVTVLRLA